MKFPKTLFVRIEEDRDSEFFIASDSLIDGEDGEKIAVYVLKEVKTKSVKHAIG